ncbi:MAG: type II toxin-antitoxin system VapC family toxin [Chloroflexota bacterium]
MGLIVVDAGIVIAILDSADTHHKPAQRSLREALSNGAALVIPASAYAEMLVAPYRAGPDKAALLDALIDALPATIQPITRPIAHAAAELRARHGARLRLPDALVVATALDLHADQILTTDRRWPELDVRIEAV